MFFKAIAGLLVGLTLLHPYIETFDFWDPPILTGQDTELTVIWVLLMISVLLVLARMLLRVLLVVLRSRGHVCEFAELFLASGDSVSATVQSLSGSPPPLRI
jgi:hypothetical protein